MIATSTLIPLWWAVGSVSILLLAIAFLVSIIIFNHREMKRDDDSIAQLMDEIRTLKASREHARATIEKINAKHAEFVKSKEGNSNV